MSTAGMGLPNLVRLEKELHTLSEDHWVGRGEKRSLALFHQVAARVPAYKDFLKKHKINPDSVKSTGDFTHIPPVDKSSYLKAYPLKMLCWDGEQAGGQWTYSTTSGSSGEPFYFPRHAQQDDQYALTAELYLRANFRIHERSTLYINGFAMGAWIGGLFTYQAVKLVAERGKYNLSIINPGIYKEEIIKALTNLGGAFDQVIIGGYPPMVKMVVDEAITQGIKLSDFNLGFVFSAEGFSEQFRDYILTVAGVKDSFRGSLNHYGTVDLGTMAHETPLSILVRKLVDNKPLVNRELYGEDHRQPTLAQYLPELFYFEQAGTSILCTANSGLPLIRYDLKDYGGVSSLTQIEAKLAAFSIDIRHEAHQHTLDDTWWNLPFVYVFERSDFTLKLYGANIYPQTIRAVFDSEYCRQWLTGRFTMRSSYDAGQNQRMEIKIELKIDVLKSNVSSSFIQKEVVARLLQENSEYANNYRLFPEQQLPQIELFTYESAPHFSAKGKQQWLQKN